MLKPKKADIIHNEYIEYLRGMQEIDRMTASQINQVLWQIRKLVQQVQKIFSLSLAGEKLSTEQLMIIQKEECFNLILNF